MVVDNSVMAYTTAQLNTCPSQSAYIDQAAQGDNMEVENLKDAENSFN